MSENVMPLLRPQDIKWGAQKLDALKEFKNVFVEAADGPFAHILLSYGNKLASPHIPDEFKDEIYAVLDEVEESDNSEAIQKAIDLVDALVQSLVHLAPGVKEIVSSVLEMLKGILLTLMPAK
jgi:hypothetical protein